MNFIAQRVVSICAFVLLTSCGGGSTAEESPGSAPAQVTPGSWVLIGSSTAAGVGAPRGEGWAAQLATTAEPMGVSLVNLARAGLQSSQALPVAAEVPDGRPLPDPAVNVEKALSFEPQLLILAFATNDAVAGVPSADTLAAIAEMQRLAAARGARTLMLSTLPRAQLTSLQRATLEATDREAAARFGPCFVPLKAALAGPDGAPAHAYAAGDGIHLNAEGHRVIHEQVLATLRSGRCVRVGAAA